MRGRWRAHGHVLGGPTRDPVRDYLIQPLSLQTRLRPREGKELVEVAQQVRS